MYSQIEDSSESSGFGHIASMTVQILMQHVIKAPGLLGITLIIVFVPWKKMPLLLETNHQLPDGNLHVWIRNHPMVHP